MKDPLGILGTETIFVMEHYSSNVLEEFENMDKFKVGVTRKSYKLPYNCDGTGAVVYGPYLYCNRYKFENRFYPRIKLQFSKFPSNAKFTSLMSGEPCSISLSLTFDKNEKDVKFAITLAPFWLGPINQSLVNKFRSTLFFHQLTGQIRIISSSTICRQSARRLK